MKKLQASFTGGELDPRLHGRPDIAKYATGAAKLENWLVLPYGGATNRPGWEFVGFAGDETQPVRVVEFISSDLDTYTLEFGHLYMRVFRFGARVLAGGVPYQIVTAYTGAQVFGISFEQSNDVLTLTHEDHPPRQLSRYDNADWRFSTTDFTPTIPAPSAVLADRILGHVYQTGEVPYVEDYTYVVTAVSSIDGRESLPSIPSTVSNDLNFRGNINFVTWNEQANVLRYNVYRKRNGVYGFVGSGEKNGTTNWIYNDRNALPDTTNGIQTQKTPFDAVGKYPKTAAYYQQRRVYGGPKLTPNRLNLSQTSDFQNFNTSFPTRDSDAIEVGLAANRRQNILHFVSVEDLLIFTSSGEWRVRGSQDTALTPSSIEAKQQSSYGCLPNVRPILVGSDVVFVTAKGQYVRSIAYDFGSNKYKGDLLSLLSAHLFLKRKVVAMAFAEAPYSTMLFVCDDGQMLSFTYMKEQETAAWSPHPTRGKFESVCVVPENYEDVPYAVVTRMLNGVPRKCIERRRTREIADTRDGFFVDCGLSYDNPVAIIGVYDNNPAQFAVNAGHGLVVGDVVDVAGFTGGIDYDQDGNGTPYGMVREDGKKLDGRYKVQAVNALAVVIQTLDGQPVDLSFYGPYQGGGAFRKPISVVTGLGHLEGMAVSGVADGAVVGEEGELIVQGGQITLQSPASRIHLGLPYDADLETLDIEIGNPAIIGEPRNVTQCWVKVHQTRGLKFGARFGAILDVVKPRNDEDYGKPNDPKTGIQRAQFGGDWNLTGRLVFRASLLPATILSITPDFETGDGNAGGDGGGQG